MPLTTLAGMAKEQKKLVTVKLSVSLVADAGAVARLLGKTAPAFMEECIREGIKKHSAKAKQRLDEIAKGQSEPE